MVYKVCVDWRREKRGYLKNLISERRDYGKTNFQVKQSNSGRVRAMRVTMRREMIR